MPTLRGDHELVAVEGDGLLERGDHPLRRTDGVALVADVADEEDELVAAEARCRVAGADRAGEALADRSEERVARLVAEAVVDDLQPVEVDEEHGEVGPVPLAARELVVQPVEEQRPVREPGERVVVGLAGQRLAGAELLGHVLDDDDVAGARRVVLGCAERADVPVLAVGAADPEVGRHPAPRAAHPRTVDERGEAAHVVGVDGVEPAAAHEGLHVGPGELGDPRVGVGHEPLARDLEDADRRGRRERAEPGLARLEGRRVAVPPDAIGERVAQLGEELDLAR